MSIQLILEEDASVSTKRLSRFRSEKPRREPSARVNFAIVSHTSQHTRMRSYSCLEVGSRECVYMHGSTPNTRRDCIALAYNRGTMRRCRTVLHFFSFFISLSLFLRLHLFVSFCVSFFSQVVVSVHRNNCHSENLFLPYISRSSSSPLFLCSYFSLSLIRSATSRATFARGGHTGSSSHWCSTTIVRFHWTRRNMKSMKKLGAVFLSLILS